MPLNLASEALEIPVADSSFGLRALRWSDSGGHPLSVPCTSKGKPTLGVTYISPCDIPTSQSGCGLLVEIGRSVLSRG